MSVRFSMEMLDDRTGRPLNVEEFAAASRQVFAPNNGDHAKNYDSTWPDICYSTMLDHDWRKCKSDVNRIQFFPGESDLPPISAGTSVPVGPPITSRQGLEILT